MAVVEAGLSPAARRALDALCRSIVPAAYSADAPDARTFDLAAAVERRLSDADPLLARNVDQALRLLEHRATALLSGRLRRFSELDHAGRERVLRAWQSSALPLRRAVFQALRRLVLATCYSQPESLEAIGYLGPYHSRGPVYAWEGPLAGEQSDDEPVLRSRGPTRDAGASIAPLGSPSAAFASARSLAPDTTLRADVCVVGSGAGGAVAAARLAEAGLDVVVLEEGGHVPFDERDEDEARMMSRLYADGGGRFTDDQSILLLQGRGIGGGSTVNWMITLRPAERVMEQWSRGFGVTLLGEDVLVPELDRIDEEIHARLVPDDAHSPGNRIILDGSARLGWRATPARINARGCLRTGFCGLGCRYGAKQDVGEVYLRRAVQQGARVYADVRAERVSRAGADRERGSAAPRREGASAVTRARNGSWIVGATVLDARGARTHRISVRATTVVVAAGAVGTPVLLQRSGMGGAGVGRHLRLHPTTAVVGRYDRDMYQAAGIPQSAICTEFVAQDDGYGFWIECPPMQPALSAASLPGFGATHRERVRDFARLASLIVLVRDGAGGDPSQGDVRAGRDGRARIRYRLREAEWRMLEDGVRAAGRLHFAAGATQALSLHNDAPPLRGADDVGAARFRRGPNRVTLFSAHVNGTCRMSGDAARGPCSPDGELRGAPGVYVADGSLFPTAPGVNPQATIMALASLVARGIVERNGSGG